MELWFGVHDIDDVLAEEPPIGLGAEEHSPDFKKGLEHVKIIRLKEMLLFCSNS